MRTRWVIAAIVLVAALGAAYTGYWFWLAQTFERNLALWIDQQRAIGYRMSYSAGPPTGFPLPVSIGLDDVRVESPAGPAPWRFEADALRLSLAPWQPFRLRIEDGNGLSVPRLQWSANGRRFDLSGDGIESTIGLPTPGELPTIALAARYLELREGVQSIAGTHGLTGNMVLRNPGAPTDSSIAFSFAAQQIDLPAGLPSQQKTKEVQAPSLEGKLIGAIPAGRLPDALAAWSAQGGYLDVTRIAAEPADGFPPRFEGAAAVALDPQLQPVVAGTVTVRDYGPAVDRAVADGLMTPAQGTAAKLWLSAKAEKDAEGLKVTLPLTIQDGVLSMGPIQLARLPRIAWD